MIVVIARDMDTATIAASHLVRVGLLVRLAGGVDQADDPHGASGSRAVLVHTDALGEAWSAALSRLRTSAPGAIILVARPGRKPCVIMLSTVWPTTTWLLPSTPKNSWLGHRRACIESADRSRRPGRGGSSPRATSALRPRRAQSFQTGTERA